MNFKINRKTTDKVFYTAISFGSYGDNEMSEQEEKDIIDDLGSPTLNLGALTYKGKLKVNDDTRVVLAEDSDSDADEVVMIVNSKQLVLGEGFKAEYQVDSKKLLKTDYAEKTLLNTPELLAEARCVLFESVVSKAITAKLQELKAKRTRFETVEIPDLTA